MQNEKKQTKQKETLKTVFLKNDQKSGNYPIENIFSTTIH